MRNPLREIEQLQGWRGRKPADLSIARIIENAADDATKTQRRLGDLIELWLELVPERIAPHTALAGFRNGVLQVKVDSAATAFEIDRLLRSGLEAELRRRFGGTLSRVKTRIEPFDDPTAIDPKREARNAERSRKPNSRDVKSSIAARQRRR